MSCHQSGVKKKQTANPAPIMFAESPFGRKLPSTHRKDGAKQDECHAPFSPKDGRFTPSASNRPTLAPEPLALSKGDGLFGTKRDLVFSTAKLQCVCASQCYSRPSQPVGSALHFAYPRFHPRLGLPCCETGRALGSVWLASVACLSGLPQWVASVVISIVVSIGVFGTCVSHCRFGLGG